jgi:succinyldiaminopimelate transaminase
MTARTPLASRLPGFPWDSIADAKRRAGEHPDGIVDLSVGTPVDPTPVPVQRALAESTDAHGYPAVIGTPELRDALVGFCRRRLHAPESFSHQHVLPVIGSKELVAMLPFQLGIGAGDVVAFPHIAYPTYEMGARLAGAEPLPLDVQRLADEGDAYLESVVGAVGADVGERIRLLWLNSPSNPTGEVLDAASMARLVDWARARDVIVASDECYAMLPWDVDEVPSVLDPRVNGGDLRGLLSTYSLSKQSNLAGYRAAFVAGDPALIAELTLVRKQSGFMPPAPVQAAMTVALADDAAVDAQVEIYRARRTRLRSALEAAGARIEGSHAGLYLWATFDEDGRTSVDRLAELGILCAPGMFYGEAGTRFVRVGLTATDERIAAAAHRLVASRPEP